MTSRAHKFLCVVSREVSITWPKRFFVHMLAAIGAFCGVGAVALGSGESSSIGFSGAPPSSAGQAVRLWNPNTSQPGDAEGVWGSDTGTGLVRLIGRRAAPDQQAQTAAAPASLRALLASSRHWSFDFSVPASDSGGRPQLDSVSVCQWRSEAPGGARLNGCRALPAAIVNSRYEAWFQPAGSDQTVGLSWGASPCETGARRCSLHVASWRLAQEINPAAAEAKGAPQLVWAEPSGDSLVVRGLSTQKVWAELKLEQAILERLGRNKGLSSVDDFGLVQSFSNGAILWDFAQDTCRVVVQHEMWSCRSGLGHGAVVRSLLRSGSDDIESLALTKFADLGALGLDTSRHEVRILGQSRGLLLFSHFVARWLEPHGLEIVHRFLSPQSEGFVRSLVRGASRVTEWGSRSFGGDTEELAIQHLSGRNFSAPVVQAISFQARESGLDEARVGRLGLYAWTRAGHQHLSAAGPLPTSIDAAQQHYRMLSERDALLWSGQGASCRVEHLQAHRDFPQSFLPSGLKVGCVADIRSARSASGVVLSVWDAKAGHWKVFESALTP